MARQTRSERRARRAAQAESQAALDRTRTRPQFRPAVEPVRSAEGGRKLPGSGFRNFVRESWAELQKVDWPGQPQLIQGTVAVLIACLIVGVYLWLADEVLRRAVAHIL
jgi:preprotein translocase subunit SecE